LWQEKPPEVELPMAMRPVLFVSAGIVAWVLLADRLGFFPAALAQLLLSAFALPNQNWRTMGIVTVLMSIGAYLLFVELLGMPLPAFGS
jgi:putative tricarboxylic transport membrane protein